LKTDDGMLRSERARERAVRDTPLPSIAGWRRASALSVSVLALVLAILTPALGAEVFDRVLAVVGTRAVTLSDVRAAEAFGFAAGTPPMPATADVLARLINRELMLTEVDRYAAPDPEAAVVDRRVAQVRARFATQESYEQALARTAMTAGRLRAVIAENLRIETYLEQRFGAAAQPTPDEVQRYYRDHIAEFTRNGRASPFEEVQAAVQQKLAGDRRRELVVEWLDRLRRRGPVEILHPAPVNGRQ
jgi:hypothetical protein